MKNAEKLKKNTKQNMKFNLSAPRYETMNYRKSGASGLLLPEISLGLWHNFGFYDLFEKGRSILKLAFDSGITHFDLANNYGPPYGSAEENFGKILHKDFENHRDELIISTKAGFDMWAGPYGDGGSKKYLFASLHQSLKRMQLEYVDIFYHHRFDSNTPLEETMAALDLMVRQGKALYVGISNYPPEQTVKAVKILRELGTPCLIHQFKYSMLERTPEKGLLTELENLGIGGIAFSPLAQGLLTDRYLAGIPENSRAGRTTGFLRKEQVSDEIIQKVRLLNEIAKNRNQSLAQMAVAWLLKDRRITSVLVGASSPEQLQDSLDSLKNTTFNNEELHKINEIVGF